MCSGDEQKNRQLPFFGGYSVFFFFQCMFMHLKRSLLSSPIFFFYVGLHSESPGEDMDCFSNRSSSQSERLWTRDIVDSCTGGRWISQPEIVSPDQEWM